MLKTIRPLPDTPVHADEAFALLNAVLPKDAGRVVLAVSGGSDSLALLVFAAQNRQRFADLGRDFHVVTVDHGLRPEAGEEARAVARLAAASGFSHRTLIWSRAGARGNLSALARNGRYAMLCEAARDFGAGVVATAHHQDDQIETHLMAAERGEGTGRLAGMRRCRDLAPGLVLARPLLDVPRRRLTASLRVRGLDWAEDPANRDPRFSRARLRVGLADISPLERQMLLDRIDNAGRERADLDRTLHGLLAGVSVDGMGIITFDRGLMRLEAGVSEALLSRVLAAAGGTASPASSEKIARLRFLLAGSEARSATLGGCRVSAVGQRIEAFREFGRLGPPSLDLLHHRTLCFDERFDLVTPPPPGARRVVPLGVLGRGGARRSTLPVMLDGAGRMVAAHCAVKRVAGEAFACCDFRERVSWRLRRDAR